MLLIRNGILHDAVHPEAYAAEILIDGGRIARIAPKIDADCAVYDADGMDIWPGFIDAHTHIGMFGYGGKGAWTKDDVEKYARCCPENRGIDCLNPLEDTFEKAWRAGVTCVCTGPGSVNCIGGTHAAVKTYGRRIDKMVLKDPCAMKIAFGENPKSTLMAKVTTRMTVAAEIRDTLLRAKEYLEKKESGKDPARNAGMEALIPVLKKEIPLKAHVQRADDTFTAIRIAKELDVNLTLEHVSDAHLIVDELAQEPYSIALGPFFAQPTKPENSGKTPECAARLMDAGLNVCVMTDSPIVAEDMLPLCGGILMRWGLDEFRALKAITVNAARHLGIQDRVGSIEEGKDADLVLARGCPMDMRVRASHVFIDGKCVC